MPFLLCKLSFCQQSNFKTYEIGYSHLIKSDSIRQRTSGIIKESIFKSCKQDSALFYVCPKIQFINLAEYKDLLLPYSDRLGFNSEELNNRGAYRKKHFFESCEIPELNRFNDKSVRYCTTVSFSKIAGKILPLVIFVNDNIGNQNPCESLKSVKFGTALIVLLVFDDSFSRIEKTLIEEVALN
jgi:hypothetical protein